MRSALVITALCAAAAVAQAQQLPAGPVDPDAPTVSLRPEKGKVQLGEPFHVWITVLHRPDMTISLPPDAKLAGTFEVMNRVETAEKQPDGLEKSVYDLTIAGFQVGKQAFPALEVGYTVNNELRRVTTDAIEIEVLSVVGDGKEELRPIAPPVAVLQKDYTVAWIAGGVAAALVLMAFGWWLATRMRRRRRIHSDPTLAARALPAEEYALERLRALARSGQLETDDLRPVYFTLSEIVREYLGRRFGFDALELTSAELLDTLDRRAGNLAVRGDIAAWLEDGDLVKYAGVPANKDEATRALEAAISIVERTRPGSVIVVPPPPTPPAEPPTAVASQTTIGEI